MCRLHAHTAPFYIRDSSSCGFGYLSRYWNQSPADTMRRLYNYFNFLCLKIFKINCWGIKVDTRCAQICSQQLHCRGSRVGATSVSAVSYNHALEWSPAMRVEGVRPHKPHKSNAGRKKSDSKRHGPFIKCTKTGKMSPCCSKSGWWSLVGGVMIGREHEGHPEVLDRGAGYMGEFSCENPSRFWDAYFSIITSILKAQKKK